MARNIIFIGPALRPDLLRKYGLEPVDVEDVVRDATARGASQDKQDGVARSFLEDTGKEMSEPGPDPTTGKEVSEPEPTGKEVSEVEDEPGTGKEMSEPGPDPTTGKEASEPEPGSGKEASETDADGKALRVIRYGKIESVEGFIRPIM
jgi:hypothetical protein